MTEREISGCDLIICSDALNGLRMLPDECVNTCVTSPPYFRMRDYGMNGQIGMESSPDDYISRLVTVFDEVYRVLRDDGTLWVNIADTYTGGGRGGQCKKQQTNAGSLSMPSSAQGLREKNLIGIPWMLAFALRDRGWYLRNDIIWSKPNPMPESVRDRCTKSHEYIFLLSKSPHYYFDVEAISEPVATSTVKRLSQDVYGQAGSTRTAKTNGAMKACAPRYGGNKYTANPDEFYRTKSGNAYKYHARRNKRDVWTVSTKPFSGAHFAVFPPEIVTPCILAGCPKDGVVLDPFIGSGTTAYVAKNFQRNFIGIDINPQYCDMTEERTRHICDDLRRI